MEEQQDIAVSLKDLWKFVLAVFGLVAVIQELRKPKDEREWHGTVAGFMPYEYRVPTLQRFKDVYWNPEGGLFGSKVFGVGWALNLGAAVGRLGLGGGDEVEEPAEA